MTSPDSTAAPFGDLSPLLAPRSIAIIGASDRAGNLGGVAVGYLRKFKFAGPIWPVNPGRDNVGGVRCYPSLDDLPGVPDLAILALPAAAIVDAARACVTAGVPAALAWAGGFAETGDEGRVLQEQLRQVCQDGAIKFCGPNCLGIMNSALGVVASFGSMLSEIDSFTPGTVSMVSQSGGLSGIASTLAQQAGFGFRLTVSSGNEVVLSLADFVRAIAHDDGTRVIALYTESIADPDNFIAALAQARDSGKAVVVLKGGASEAAGRAALAHTGRLAGSDQTYDAIFREFGAVRVYSVEELIEVCLLLSTQRPGCLPKGNGVVLTSFGGGTGVLNTDQCIRNGLSVPRLTEDTRRKLGPLLTPLAAANNPVDLTPQSMNDPQWRALLPEALKVMSDDPGIHSFLFMSSGMGQRGAEITSIIKELRAYTRKTVCVSWMTAPASVAICLAAEGIYTFQEHGRAARALGNLARYAEVQKLRIHKSSHPLPAFGWSDHVDAVPADGVVSENVVAAILESAGLPVARGRLAKNADDAVRLAEDIGYPVVLKGISSAVTHRAAAGLLALNVAEATTVRRVDEEFRARADDLGVAYDGTWVQRMMPGGTELLVTALRDPDFGIIVGCGLGGNLTEIIDDVAFARAPIDADGAFDLLGVLPSVQKHPKLLPGNQRRMAADFIARFSALAASAPWQRFTLEINPLKLGGDEMAAVDGLLIIGSETDDAEA